MEARPNATVATPGTPRAFLPFEDPFLRVNVLPVVGDDLTRTGRRSCEESGRYGRVRLPAGWPGYLAQREFPANRLVFPCVDLAGVKLGHAANLPVRPVPTR